MSQQMNPAQVEMVKVECVRCRRVVRTVAYWGVVGREGLERIGWTVDGLGKAVCDMCDGQPGEGVMMVPCHEPEVGPDGQMLPPRALGQQTKPAELETIQKFQALVERLHGLGHLKTAHLADLVNLVAAVRHACIREEWGKD